MQNQTTKLKKPFYLLAGMLFILVTCAAQYATAERDGDEDFTNASLKGTYAYVNNNGGVASFGPVIFDGRGEITIKDKVNLPCSATATPPPGPTCARTIVNLTGRGSYTVESDGTGVAQIAFVDNNGTSVGTANFDFVVSETTRQRGKLLATQVFSAQQTGGLAGQLVAPIWSRISDARSSD